MYAMPLVRQNDMSRVYNVTTNVGWPRGCCPGGPHHTTCRTPLNIPTPPPPQFYLRLRAGGICESRPSEPPFLLCVNRTFSFCGDIPNKVALTQLWLRSNLPSSFVPV